MLDRLLVSAVAAHSPASEEGIRIGDKITRIAGKKIEYLEPEDIPRLLQQPTVRLEIEAAGETSLREVILPKRTIPPVTIPCAFMLNDSTAYIKIERFSQGTPDEFDQAVAQWRPAQPSYLILDLRDNGGGDLNAAIKVVDRFLPPGRLIAYTRGRGPGSNMQYFATNGKKFPNIPLIVLVNKASASDAEIVAGALQDWDRALIVGQPTYGKALVQTEFPFQDGSALLLTTARFFTPLGRSLEKNSTPSDLSEPTHQSTESVSSYRTPKGRMIKGGGSIIPDIILPEKESLAAKLQSLLNTEENYFISYAVQYYDSHPAWGKNKEQFVHYFQVSDDMLRDFMVLLRRAGKRFTLQDFAEHKEELQWLIKREIGALFWGEEARYMVNVTIDSEVNESSRYLRQAKNLLYP